MGLTTLGHGMYSYTSLDNNLGPSSHRHASTDHTRGSLVFCERSSARHEPHTAVRAVKRRCRTSPGWPAGSLVIGRKS